MADKINKTLTKQTFTYYLQHALKYRVIFALIVILVILASVANVLSPVYYKKFFDLLTQSGEMASMSQFTTVLLTILLIDLSGWVCWRALSFMASYSQTHVMADLFNSCFAYLHKHSVSFFNNNFAGSLVKKVNRFVYSFGSIMDVFVWNLIPILINVSLIIYILSRRNIWVGLAVLLWVVIFLIINFIFSRYKLKYDVKRSELDSKVSGVLADTITNQLNIKLFNGYQRENNTFRKVTGQLQSLRNFTWNLTNYFDAVQTLMMIGLEIGLMFYALHLWRGGSVTIGDFVLIQAYLINMFDRLWDFGRIIRYYYEAMADAQEMTEVLETPHDIVDVPKAKQLKVNKGQIEFVDVSFSYNQTRQIIKNFNLTIRPQEKVAIVGPSGGGKSTIASILLRQHDLADGQINIDGQNINKVTQESLWSNISLVNQDPILFHRTLSENISYGLWGSSQEQVVKAAKMAHCHDFIKGFTEGYGTFVGERGVRLSGGERQRVAMARAIIKNAPILVLDEATSSLDSESEELIQKALANLMKNKTVIVIAHRLSTIMKMDRIVVVDKGQIVEQGTHQELLKIPDGFYQRLWSKQVGGFII
ncbi:MAG: ATP-binding cassette, subfamily bacterial [Patescibacteria group bacterium]|nr:ATP-binding cassette, subfamily bacterial [Patescibacteria group bacterium]